MYFSLMSRGILGICFFWANQCGECFSRGRLSSSSLNGLSSSRRPIVGGNWKCHGTCESVEGLIGMLKKTRGDLPSLKAGMDVVVAPSMLHVQAVLRGLADGDVSVAAQNIGVSEGFGAFTGEISGEMLRDSGVEWVLTGHSERREAGESNDLVARKTKVALQQNLKTIACVGEKKDEREGGRTMEVLSQQLIAIAKELRNNDWENVVVAYEPVWAIGTGLTATPEMAQETHKDIRNWLKDNVNAKVAAETRIIYGGSVKGANAGELFEKEDIDGFLVGGASLSEDFLNILKATNAEKALVS